MFGKLEGARHSFVEDDEESSELIMRWAWHRRLREAAHLGMRVRLKNGKVLTPRHREESCPHCWAEREDSRAVERSNLRFDADAMLRAQGSSRLTRIR